jgi:hypothetical protein
VSAPVREPRCALCDRPATVFIEPIRRTLERGVDPDDQSYSITVILPDVPVCGEHFPVVRLGNRLVGWCDDESCRSYGEVGKTSSCGNKYEEIRSGNRARSSHSSRAPNKAQAKRKESD